MDKSTPKTGQVSDPKLSVFPGRRFSFWGRPKKVLAGTPRLKNVALTSVAFDKRPEHRQGKP